ncbi:MAG: hypothetical protein HDR29_07855, partial [Lachnospiraceae bacterium]|nr:hypothetical protein [Lachnospiraceae bacterium]
MKKRKLLKKRILALALSAAMMFAQADSYAVLAAAPENSGETLEYDESQTVLADDLETEESGTEEIETEKSELENDSEEEGESSLTDEAAPVENPESEGVVDSDTKDSDIVG